MLDHYRARLCDKQVRRHSRAAAILRAVCGIVVVVLCGALRGSRGEAERPTAVSPPAPPQDTVSLPLDADRLALQPKKDATKTGPGRKRGSGLVGVSVEYDDLRCQAIQARYSVRIPPGAVVIEVDGYRLPLANPALLAAAPAPYLFLSRGVHQLRFRQNESAIATEIEKDFLDEYGKMRRFFDVDKNVRNRELLQRSARAMDVHATPFLLNFLAASYAAQDRWPAAERTFQRALAINPCFAPAHLNLAECLLRRGARERALAEIDLAEVFNVENVFGLTPAISRMRIDLQLPPLRPSAETATLVSYETSETLTDQDRRVVGVLRALAKYAVADEERSKILNNIGAHFAEAGKPEAALAHYRSALAVARGAGDQRFQLARQILSHMHAACQRAGFDEAADYEVMMTLVSP